MLAMPARARRATHAHGARHAPYARVAPWRAWGSAVRRVALAQSRSVASRRTRGLGLWHVSITECHVTEAVAARDVGLEARGLVDQLHNRHARAQHGRGSDVTRERVEREEPLL